MNKLPRVTLYSSRQCAHCKQLKQVLLQNNIKFMEFDVQSNRRAAKDFQRLGARGVPVLLVGESRLDGFQPQKLNKLLKQYKLI